MHAQRSAAFAKRCGYMAQVFITGSADGLGRMAAQLLIEQGHTVTLHARNQARGREAMAAVPGAETVVIGDLASINQTRKVAEQVNALGKFDAVIHNAAIGYQGVLGLVLSSLLAYYAGKAIYLARRASADRPT